jgi:hypothetical protein
MSITSELDVMDVDSHLTQHAYPGWTLIDTFLTAGGFILVIMNQSETRKRAGYDL